MKTLKYVGLAIYVCLVIVLTGLLFTFNKFSDSVINGKTISYAKEDMGKFKKGDLLIVSKNSNIKVNDDIVFYDTNNNKNFLNVEKVKKVMYTNEKETTYVIRDNEYLSSEYVVGTSDTTKRVARIGYLYKMVTSKLGYLLLVMIPLISYFIYELKRSGYVKKKKN